MRASLALFLLLALSACGRIIPQAALPAPAAGAPVAAPVVANAVLAGLAAGPALAALPLELPGGPPQFTQHGAMFAEKLPARLVTGIDEIHPQLPLPEALFPRGNRLAILDVQVVEYGLEALVIRGGHFIPYYYFFSQPEFYCQREVFVIFILMFCQERRSCVQFDRALMSLCQSVRGELRNLCLVTENQPGLAAGVQQKKSPESRGRLFR